MVDEICWKLKLSGGIDFAMKVKFSPKSLEQSSNCFQTTRFLCRPTRISNDKSTIPIEASIILTNSFLLSETFLLSSVNFGSVSNVVLYSTKFSELGF